MTVVNRTHAIAITAGRHVCESAIVFILCCITIEVTGRSEARTKVLYSTFPRVRSGMSGRCECVVSVALLTTLSTPHIEWGVVRLFAGMVGILLHSFAQRQSVNEVRQCAGALTLRRVR